MLRKANFFVFLVLIKFLIHHLCSIILKKKNGKAQEQWSWSVIVQSSHGFKNLARFNNLYIFSGRRWKHPERYHHLPFLALLSHFYTSNNILPSTIFTIILGGQGLGGSTFHEKQVIHNSGSNNTLQVSANTGPGNGLINEMFPDELFENDARTLHGATTFHVDSEGNMTSSYPNVQHHPQVNNRETHTKFKPIFSVNIPQVEVLK